MKYRFTVFLILFVLPFLFFACEESTEPEKSNQLKLILTADKTSGPAPLTVNFSAQITGDTTGLCGLVPDYIFFKGQGNFIIRYIIPDSLQKVRPTWSAQTTYFNSGTVKVVLLYQGFKNNTSYDLWSDTLVVSVQ